MKRIYIYSDLGVSRVSYEHLAHLFSKSRCIRISAEEVAEGSWRRSCDLFVIPGGADVPYDLRLRGKGNAEIRAYVEGGGRYLGICAGSYYAGQRVVFAEGTPLEVIGERELGFFPGEVRGPCLAPYEYDSLSGARAANVYGHEATVCMYYNGGGFFAMGGEASAEVIAWYDEAREWPAIVRCRVGLGWALLSGVHFEFCPKLLSEEEKKAMEPLYSELERGEKKRKVFIEKMLPDF